ncbi:hypothetical protein BT67DRAFT_464459 [Trichocladium antarcticum]|uniref:DNA replication factor Cdt1 C-terminal domain-containing protein n=1 Tax=Trichocladium antarcticum TaxID=1450529 RepID=A0AAN6ZAR6_9PEZI|nr:hypothetical protein BT67DRAFT_464459 [Trichocladium antarcticum]
MPGLISQKTRTTRGKLAASKLPSADVNSYAKISKLQLIGKNAAEKTASPSGRTSSIEIALPSRKRKVEDDAASTSKKVRREQPDAPCFEPATPVSRRKKTVKFAELEAVPSTPSRTTQTPSSSRKRRFQSEETTQAETLFERLALQSPVCKRTKAAAAHNDLPQELVDLLGLHVAFLKTLSMQCVHNGTNSPIDLRTLYPSVTRTWGKRQVSLEDIQRCVGVLNWTPVKNGNNRPKSPFFLADYGRGGKVCVDFHPHGEPGPLPEQLNMDFEANLRTLWLNRRDQAIPLFMATLPMATLKPCHALAKVVGPARTQTTLADFKKSIPPKKQEKAEPATPTPTPTAAAATAATPKLSLLERIRLRETQRAEAPQGPSVAEIQRQAALHRAVDVAAVIGMLSKAALSSGQQVARVSFTMSAVLVRLKDSMRTPVSQEDGAVCVRLLAAEVAPAWLRVVTIAGRENVIVQPGFQMGKGEIEDKVRVLLG